MSRVCAVTGRRTRVGHQVTRRGLAKKQGGVGRRVTGRSKRKFKPNIHTIRVLTPEGGLLRLKVSTKVIKTGAGAHAFRAFGDKRHVLVSNRVANTISRIDLQTLEVVDSFPAPGGPDCIDVSRDGKQILVTSRWARKLTVIDVATRKVVRQVNVGKSPHGVWTLDHSPR